MSTHLPIVKTKKEFMDYLESIIYPPKSDDDPSRGRLRELKAYVIESEDGFQSESSANNISYKVIDTGLNDIKILHVTLKDKTKHEFFLNVDDDRFFTLHTNERSEDAGNVIQQLIKEHHGFDNAWFYSDMLKQFASKSGNTPKGFGVSYSDNLLCPTNDESDIEDLNLSINGSLAVKMQECIKGRPDIERAMAYNKIQIQRGSKESLTDWVQDDISNKGYFAVKHGKSVQDHLHLVDICKKEYSKMIDGIEKLRIGPAKTGDEILVEGNSFDFEFSSKIKDLDMFIERMFDCTVPFKLWGMKSKIRDGYFKVMAVDLHTGSPIDFEISDDLMRVYLFKGNCGNTILRLFTNLQISDSKIKCAQLEEIAHK